MGASFLRRTLLCPLGLCETFKTASNDHGVWGQCEKCGKVSGYVSRSDLRKFAESEERRAQRARDLANWEI